MSVVAWSHDGRSPDPNAVSSDSSHALCVRPDTVSVVHHLGELFYNLEYCENPAVTPTKELAKLALVTSLDEEEDEQSGTGTDASNDTDATLVDDGPIRQQSYDPPASAQSPTNDPSTSSVLGKRGRDLSNAHKMDVDVTADVDKDGYVVVSKPPSPAGQPSSSTSTSTSTTTTTASSVSESAASSSKHTPVEEPPDVEMIEDTRKPAEVSKPPPLPPRRPKEVGESVMMFGTSLMRRSLPFVDLMSPLGRQHDVSECMDNCMFQIETALLDFQDEEMDNADPDKTSIVKRFVQCPLPLLSS